jgi:hypothetical protein
MSTELIPSHLPYRMVVSRRDVENRMKCGKAVPVRAANSTRIAGGQTLLPGAHSNPFPPPLLRTKTEPNSKPQHRQHTLLDVYENKPPKIAEPWQDSKYIPSTRRKSFARICTYFRRSPASDRPAMTSRKHSPQPSTARLGPCVINRTGRFLCEVPWNSL